jgi:hypothetical protein
MHFYEVRLRKDKRGVDLISDALPFGRLWHEGPIAFANAIGYAKHYIRSHDAVGAKARSDVSFPVRALFAALLHRSVDESGSSPAEPRRKDRGSRSGSSIGCKFQAQATRLPRQFRSSQILKGQSLRKSLDIFCRP